MRMRQMKDEIVNPCEDEFYRIADLTHEFEYFPRDGYYVSTISTTVFISIEFRLALLPLHIKLQLISLMREPSCLSTKQHPLM